MKFEEEAFAIKFLLKMDYNEKKFQEDLEKAKALSLETMAFDQYRRNKKQYSSVNDITENVYKRTTCKYDKIVELNIYCRLFRFLMI